MVASGRPCELRVDAPRIRFDDGGVIRVGNSRVSLDLVVDQFENGMTPEDNVRAYDSLDLADVYSAISYYLCHTDEILIYLKSRNAEAIQLRTKSEGNHLPITRDGLQIFS